MKKNIYYVLPLIIVPGFVLMVDFVIRMNWVEPSHYILVGGLLSISAIMGIFSPTHRRFDYFMTAMMPLTFFCLAFVYGFLNKSDLETRFHIDEAVEVAFQPLFLMMYPLMAAVTFVASFRYFRNIRKGIVKK